MTKNWIKNLFMLHLLEFYLGSYKRVKVFMWFPLKEMPSLSPVYIGAKGLIKVALSA